MPVIVIANAKGGCGKTTMAVTLAGALARAGRAVSLVDADPQRSAVGWLVRRPAAAAPIEALDWSHLSPAALSTAAATPAQGWRIIDTAGSLEGERAEILTRFADAVATPIGPSCFDVQASLGFLARMETLLARRKRRVELAPFGNRLRPEDSERFQRLFRDLEMTPLTEIADHPAYPELAEQGLSIFDKDTRVLRRLQREWRALLDVLGAEAKRPRRWPSAEQLTPRLALPPRAPVI